MNSICDLSIPQDAIPYQAGIGFALPWVEGTIPAGFPSPAADFLVKRQDLNDLIIQNPTATFFWQARGPSMIEAGIFDGDILVIDRSISAVHGSIVVAEVDNDFTVKYLHRRGGQVSLRAANPTFKPITFKEGQTLTITGVVIATIKRFSR